MKRLISLFAMVFTLTALGAEVRTKNLDFVILMDKSLSMDNKIGEVKKFFTNQILDKELIPGDTLLIVLFYGKTEILIDTKINSNADIEIVKSALAPIEGDGRYTDIGNAIDFTYNEVTTNRPKDAIRHFILLTDGRQEAPPESQYKSTDFSIKHPALGSAKELARKGWKIQILGLGTDTEAENLANQLSAASYIFDDEKALAQAKNINFFEDLTLSQTPRIDYLEGSDPLLSLNLHGERMSGPRELVINQIRFPGIKDEILTLAQPFRIKLDPNQDYKLEIPLNAEAIPMITSFFGGNENQGEVAFQFGGDIAFSPGILKTDYRSFSLSIPIIIGLIILVAFGIWLMMGLRWGEKLFPGLSKINNKVVPNVEPPKTHQFY